MTPLETVHLAHNKVSLALHRVRDGQGRPLLLLHGLGEDSSRMAAMDIAWPGPVWALDFTGHGQSTVPMGGGYSCEILMADADVALRHIGACTVLGRGLGGYVAFLIAGARPSLVRGAVITDGPGLAGGPVHVSSTTEIAAAPRAGTAPDPWAIIELSRDARPATYALTFLRLAMHETDLDEPITSCARVSPPWLEAITPEAGVLTGVTVQEALDIYSAV
ncbi:MAG: alpha/beta hydrolase [Actinomycetota bacterium]